MNEALDGLRPYGLEGIPMPWHNSTRIVSSNNSKSYKLNQIVDKLTSQLQSWCSTFMGALPNSELLNNNKRHIRHQEDLDKLWEEKLAENLAQEIEKHESRWVNYGLEEARVKVNLSDLVFECMLQETVSLLDSISNRFE